MYMRNRHHNPVSSKTVDRPCDEPIPPRVVVCHANNNANDNVNDDVPPLHQRSSPAKTNHPDAAYHHHTMAQLTSTGAHAVVSNTSAGSGIDDADVAAGAQEIEATYFHTTQQLQQQQLHCGHHHHKSPLPLTLVSNNNNIKSSSYSLSSAPPSANSIETSRYASDVEFFEDLVSEPVLVLGVDISHLSRQLQFIACASGVFFFSLLYGYLQELISVQLCNRKLGLFLAMVQFSGYTVLAYAMRQMVYEKQKKHVSYTRTCSVAQLKVPFYLYLALSLLRAVDLGMTNVAMQYINYPAKTLMKSSRVVFTMIFGAVITRKRYQCLDYLIVVFMVAGLALFMHADANSSAVFHHMGVIMLTVSLVCDGAITNMSESIMSNYGVGQDEFIFRMYSIALVAITAAAAYKGDLREGILWLSQPGTYDELHLPINERTWSVPGKIMCIALFSAMGFFGSSCSAAITKNFGALSMSITSTARKATTLFLSFFLFNNVCTFEHVSGMVVFITALTIKSIRRRGKSKSSSRRRKRATLQVLPINKSNSNDSVLPLTVVPRAFAASPMDRGDDLQPLFPHKDCADESSLSSIEADSYGKKNPAHIV